MKVEAWFGPSPMDDFSALNPNRLDQPSAQDAQAP
jgi:hypothetical protein